MFEWNLNKEYEDRKIRSKLEKAYEQEKLKVIYSPLSNYLVSNNEEMQQNISRVPEEFRQPSL